MPTQGSKFEVLSEEEVLRRHALEKERQIARSETLARKREKKRLKNGNISSYLYLINDKDKIGFFQFSNN